MKVKQTLAAIFLLALAFAAAAAGGAPSGQPAKNGGTLATAPTITPMHAEFVEGEKATHYTVTVTAPAGTPTATWTLKPPDSNPTCTSFAPTGSTSGANGVTFQAVWKHSDADGCSHAGTQHLGTVTITVKEGPFICTAAFLGTLTNDGPTPPPCAEPNCDKEKLAVATAQGKVTALQDALDALRQSTVDPAIARVDSAVQGVQNAAYDYDHTWKSNMMGGRHYKGSSGASVSGALDEAEAELKQALAQLQQARAAYKEIAAKLAAAKIELDAAQKALAKCLGGGTPDRHAAAASPAATPTVDCTTQQDAANTGNARASGYAAAGKLVRPAGLTRAGSRMHSALQNLQSVKRYAAGFPKAKGFATELGKVLISAGQASTSLKRILSAQHAFASKAAAATTGAANAQAALKKCQSGG